MSFLRRVRERYRGREFWRGANRVLIVVLYTFLLVGVMAFPMHLGYLIFAYVVFIPSYVAFFINHLREMEKRDKGSKVIEGWVTHGYKVGERVYFNPIRFEIVDKLPPADLIAVKAYVSSLGEYSKVAKKGIGLDRFKLKQLTYKQAVEIEEMNEKERKKFDNEETKERDILVEEHKKMKEHIEEVNNKKTTTNKDVSKDE